MEGNIIDIKVFKYGTIELPLDCDDMAVDERIEAAFERMGTRGAEYDKHLPAGSSKMRKMVDIAADCMTEIFDRPDAATLIIDGETGYIAIMKRIAEAVKIIGQMRSEVFKQANAPFIAANTARVLRETAIKENWPGVKPKGAPVPKKQAGRK